MSNINERGKLSEQSLPCAPPRAPNNTFVCLDCTYAVRQISDGAERYFCRELRAWMFGMGEYADLTACSAKQPATK